jgi:chaperonin cofactor prefoldin
MGRKLAKYEKKIDVLNNKIVKLNDKHHDLSSRIQVMFKNIRLK